MKKIKFLSTLIILFLFATALTSCKTQQEAEKKTDFTKKENPLSPKQQQEFSGIYLDANRSKIIGNYDQAIILFKKALEIDPQSAAARYEIGRIYAENQNYPAALSYAQDAYQLEGDNVWYAQFLGQLYSETGNLNKSIEIYKEIVKKHPNDYDYYFNLGSLLSAQGQYDDALKLYDELESKAGASEELTLQRQMIYIDKGDYESALKEIDSLIAENPEEVRLYGMKAEIYQKLGEPEKAKTLYEEMLDMEPENGLVLLSLHDIAQKEDDKAKAQEYLEKAFSSTDLSIDVKVNILINYLSAPDFKENSDTTLELMRRMEKANPDEAKTYAVEGDIYYNLDQIDSARVKFRHAVKLDPNRPPIWQQILTIDSQLNDFEAMETESATAVELFPQLPMFYLFSGIALLQQKKTEEAIDQLNTGKNLVLDDPRTLGQFYASLGDSYHTMGDNEKSDEAYDMALKYDASNVIVLNNYAYYLSLRNKDLDKAEKMAKQANDLSPDVASFQDTYAWVLYQNQNYQNALFWIEEAMKNGAAQDPEVLNHRGDILLKLKRIDEAVESWKKALASGGDKEELDAKIKQYSTQ